MEYLLNNELAPITYSWGFFERPLPVVSNAYGEWQRSLNMPIVEEPIELDLKDALLRLDPLCWVAPQRCLVLETRSSWTAIFEGDLSGGGPVSAVGHLCRVLECRGVFVRSKPKASGVVSEASAASDESVGLTLYAPHDTDWLNIERHISLVNENGRWRFSATGEVQPFEQTKLYRDRRVRNRFSSAVLKEYCEALGIRLISPEFYGPRGTLYVNKLPPPEGFSLIPIKDALSWRRKRFSRDNRAG